MNEKDGHLDVMIAFANSSGHLSSSLAWQHIILYTSLMLATTRFSHNDASVRMLMNETHRYYLLHKDGLHACVVSTYVLLSFPQV